MHRTQTQKVYSFYSRFYDVVFGTVLEEGRKSVFKNTQFEPQARILEVGIGTGLTIKRYPSTCSIHGLDISEEMLSKAKERTSKPTLKNRDISLIKADAVRIPYKDESFDVVMGCYMLTTVKNPRSVLREMIRVTKRKGRLILLNHFMSQRQGIRNYVEKVSSPFFSRIGFRTDLELSTLAQVDGIQKEKELKVNPFRFFTLIQLQKNN